MTVIERQHLDSKMDELAAGVTGYMNEEAAKEGGEKEATSLPRYVLTNVTEANTPPGATGKIPHAPQADHSAEAALLTGPPSS